MFTRDDRKQHERREKGAKKTKKGVKYEKKNLEKDEKNEEEKYELNHYILGKKSTRKIWENENLNQRKKNQKWEKNVQINISNKFEKE